MNPVRPGPIPALAWLLRLVSSRHAADAAIGDILEDLHERMAAGRGPRRPRLWINLQTLRAVGASIETGMPRFLRSAALMVRDAWRALRAAPAHALFIVLVLAIGITAGTVTFSVVDAVVLKPLPIDEPHRLVTIAGPDFKRPITPEMYWQLHDRLPGVEGLGARSTSSGEVVTVGALTGSWPISQASADIFRLLHWSPAIGRFWTTEEEARGETDIAVIGHRLWRERFQSSSSVLGEKVVWGKRTYRVIGVLPAATDRAELDQVFAPIWVPLVVPRGGTGYRVGILARMRPGVTPAQVAAEVERIVNLPDWRAQVRPLMEPYVSRVRSWMLLALGAAGLVVLIACVNAANLMLTRSAGRSHELAVRASLGASRRHLATAMVTEGLLLAFAATACALVGAAAGVGAARAAITTMLPGVFRADTIALNERVFAAALVAAVVTGLVVSIVPAWQASRAPLSSLLKDANTVSAATRKRWRSAFLVTEVATVVVLLVVSWLFVVSLIRAQSIDLGIDRDNLVAVLPRDSFQGTVDEVQRRVESMPGVVGVAVSLDNSPPLFSRAFHGAWGTTTLRSADGPPGREAMPLSVGYHRVTPNYFAIMGMRLLRGRTWSSEPRLNSTAVVLAEPAARQIFGEVDPVGLKVRRTDPEGIYTVVGTVPHVYAGGPERTEPPAAYFALQPDAARTYAALLVKTSRPAAEMVPLLNEVLKPVAPNTPADEPFVFLADDAVRRITAQRRFNAGLMSAFGLVGMLIGAAGVYAVMASFVGQQTREIGVRLALGATLAQIQRGVLVQAWRHLLAGLALGIPVAWWLSRGFTSLLFQVTGADVSVYLVVAAVLLAAGFVAAWVPARRAARIDPLTSLRANG